MIKMWHIMQSPHFIKFKKNQAFFLLFQIKKTKANTCAASKNQTNPAMLFSLALSALAATHNNGDRKNKLRKLIPIAIYPKSALFP